MTYASSQVQVVRVPIPFTVIGGFLGAGKTTAINAIVTGTASRRIAVLVNDFGSLAIDAALVAEHNATTISLTNGCVCCSLVGGLVQALLDVVALDPAPDQILVEASGVSDPGRIAQIARADPCLLPDATIVLVAADQWRALSADRHVGDTVVAQLAAADFLVLNKVDLVSREEVDALRSQLSALAPRARLLQAVGARLPYDVLLGHAIDEAVGAAHASDETTPPAMSGVDDVHAQQFSTRIFRSDKPLSRASLRDALDHLPPPVLRAKGFVHLDPTDGAQSAWHLIQAVASRWSLTPVAPRAAGHASELIVMGATAALADADLSALASAFGMSASSASWRRTSRPDSALRHR